MGRRLSERDYWAGVRISPSYQALGWEARPFKNHLWGGGFSGLSLSGAGGEPGVLFLGHLCVFKDCSFIG